MSRPWTRPGLMALYALAAGGCSLEEMAEAVGRPRGDCDLALWALVGRAPDQALGRLNPAAKMGITDHG